MLIAGSLAAGGVSAVAKDSAALDLAKQLNQAFTEVADKVSPAVVVITVTQKANVSDGAGAEGDDSWWDMVPKEFRRYFEERRGQPRSDGNGRGRRFQHPPQQGRGSGIVISEDGYILTNNHVVENADKIRVRFKDSKEYDAEVKGTDPESDLAVIKINKVTGLIPAKLGDSDKTHVGEFAIAIGAPFDLSYSVTVGHVSAKGRSFEGFGEGYADQDFIQTDASINPGNSGGPLVNLYGEVIGINAMIRGMNTGIGFAIPINLAKRVKDHLINEGKFTRSWLGVRIGELNNDQEFKKLVPDLEDGVIIHQIEPSGPAAKSDLKASDVVVAVDGRPVKTARELKDEISTKRVGQTVTLDVVRGTRHVAVKVKTEALPGEEGLTKTAHKTDSGEIESSTYGLTVKAVTKELADQFGVEVTAGVIVTAVEQNSPADQKGIKPGDVITEINRKQVSNPKQFREALKATDAKRGMIVNLISNGSSKFVVLKESGE